MVSQRTRTGRGRRIPGHEPVVQTDTDLLRSFLKLWPVLGRAAAADSRRTLGGLSADSRRTLGGLSETLK